MSDPILVEVLRGDTIESAHRGAVAVFDAAGTAMIELGDIDRPVFPRSAVKVIQALPLIETGAADAYGFGQRELALACASHSGEPDHAATANAMLGRAGLGNEALECGAHWPMSQDATVALARDGGKPLALHNNCSGKHSGFVCVCCHEGHDHHGYVGASHWLQRTVREAMEDVTGAAHDEANMGIDGCSIPTYAVPLRNLAIGFARLATGERLGPQRAEAAKRLMAACMAEPFYVAGTGRADTKLMTLGASRLFVKTGAEGVYCAAVPELGFGIALKCDDGAGRAAEVVVSAVLSKLLDADGKLSADLKSLANPTLTNWNGLKVGSLRPTVALA